MQVTLTEMLQARERRADRQKVLFQKYGKTLICFTMNIAGPIKNSGQIQRGFQLGVRVLKEQLQIAGIDIAFFEENHKETGNEAFFVVDKDPYTVKKIAVEVEEYTQIGKLLYIEVFDSFGERVRRCDVGARERTCLICGGTAQVCARSRTHSVEQLQQESKSILLQSLQQADSHTIAQLACQALLYEVATTPKPGLVDRANSGSHRDMDIFSFQASAAALWPYFLQCAEIGMRTRTEAPEKTFVALRIPGKQAEGDMLRATGGVNTHKGAIFSMGLLCGALGRLKREQWGSPERILLECSAMTVGIVERDFAGLTSTQAKTTGQALYIKYGVTGVRGQAEAGFPAVLNVGLPKLEHGLAHGKTFNEAGCAALLAMLAVTVDTNLIHRGGYEKQQEVAAAMNRLLAAEPFPSEKTLELLDKQFIELNLSPGGTADLLALVYMLYFLKGVQHE